MRTPILILGVIILIAGLAVAGYYGFEARLRTYGSIGVAVIGFIIAAGGALMKPASAAAMSGQFSCAKCGMKFGTEGAMKAHVKDKHVM